MTALESDEKFARDLAKYGRHGPGCKRDGMGHGFRSEVACTCGLDKAIGAAERYVSRSSSEGGEC